MHTSTPARNRVLVAHPFLFGLFPLLSILSVNLGWASYREALLPALVVLAIAALLWVLLWPVLVEPRKRGLVISLFWLPFYAYGAIVDVLRDRLDFRDMLSPTQMAMAGLLVLGAAMMLLLLLRRARVNLDRLNSFLNGLSLILISITLITCLTTTLRGYSFHQKRIAPVAVKLNPTELASLPSIYFIVCDAYPRGDYLKDFFEYDNSGFLQELRNRHFFVADRSRSNYCHTLPSLASTLNLDYLDPAIVPRQCDENYPRLMPLIRDSLVVRTLRAHGYEFVVTSSILFPNEMSAADRFIRPGAFNNTEYQQTLIDMTPIRSIMNRIHRLRWYQLVPFSLDTLGKLQRQGKPMFVYAHLLAPHTPHAYDREGNFVDAFPPYKEGWRTVTEYLNARLVNVVDAILQREPNAIIIIQGDHGCNNAQPNPKELGVNPWTGAWPDYVRDRSANLSTVYLPDRSPEALFYPELTPVNLFRILFNAYLKTDYPRLEDVTWLTPQNSRDLVSVRDVY